MKQIYYIETYYQLLTAIQIRTALFPDAEADIIISDISVGAFENAERLRALNVFRHVYTACVREAHDLNTLQKKIDRVVRIITDDTGVVQRQSDIRDTDYDELYTFCINFFTSSLCYQIQQKNPHMRFYQFEEGFRCNYEMLDDKMHSRTIDLRQALRRIRRKPIFHKDGFYFYDPDLAIPHGIPMHAIPKIEGAQREKMRQIMNGMFGDVGAQDYSRKYIFLESCYGEMGVKIDDVELVSKIADKVGRENLMVKLHPRTRTDRFAPYGITTNKVVGVPWEAIILNLDLSKNVFLTVASAGVLTPRILFGEQPTAYMLFNCTKYRDPWITADFYAYLERYKKKYGETGFYIPENADDFLASLPQA